jgi:glycosyltransferase involved in cell wall biosynthesis
MKISVIICTHNPRRPILGRALEALRTQTLDRGEWELIVVDNASDEDVAGWLDVQGGIDGRIIRENALGKIRAIARGLAVARGELVVFVDDDNFLEANYLEKSLDIAARWPMLGVWGGRILPEFERTPPEWTSPYWDYLTIRDCPYDQWSNIADQYEGMPPGAGLVIRREIALVYAELLKRDPVRMALDRNGKMLTSGADTDMAFTACDLGYGAARLSSLELRHYMPEARFEERYLLRMVEGIAYSMTLVAAIRGRPGSQPSALRYAWQYCAGWKMSPRNRRFWHAQQRGVRRADAFIRQQAELQIPRDVRKMARDTAKDLRASCCTEFGRQP